VVSSPFLNNVKTNNLTKPARPNNKVAVINPTSKARRREQALILRPDQLLQLMRSAPPAAALALAIVAFAGLRVAELRNLDWADVRLDDGHILVPAKATKRKRQRSVPISPNLDQWLRPCAKPSGQVTPKIPGAAVRHAAQAIGINRPFPALRHSFICYRKALAADWFQTYIEADSIAAHSVRPASVALAQEWFNVVPSTLQS
jgi:integrase